MTEKSKQAFLSIGFSSEALESLHSKNCYSEEQYLLAAAHLSGKKNLEGVGIIKSCIDGKWYAEPVKETAQDCNRSFVLNELPNGGVMVEGKLGSYEISPLNKELEFSCKFNPMGTKSFSYDSKDFKKKVAEFIEKCGLKNPLKSMNLLPSFC